jgi:hypothetical protein
MYPDSEEHAAMKPSQHLREVGQRTWLNDTRMLLTNGTAKQAVNDGSEAVSAGVLNDCANILVDPARGSEDRVGRIAA